MIPPGAISTREGPIVDVDRAALAAWLAAVLNRFPSVGLAAGVVRAGHVEFAGHGAADISSKAPITEETVFRIGSITKTLTSVAVSRLVEQGLVDLDAPANDYLRAYRIAPADPRWQPVTLRHLLTHTSGIPDVLRAADLVHPSWGPFDSRLAEYYRERLRPVVEPGSAFAYSNHGFATAGQIVEDVSGMPLDRSFREHIFEPLGMTDSDLARTNRTQARLATGYILGSTGPKAIVDREWLGRGGGGVYSSSRDLARYVAALLGGGANEHGRVLQPASLETMFEPHYQADPRLTGVGLGFFHHRAGTIRLVGHDGILPGFTSSLLVAPQAGVGVFALTNGSRRAMIWLPDQLERLMRRLLDVSPVDIRTDVPNHPEIWDDLCGRYRLPVVGDLRGRLMMGGGIQVFAGSGRMMIRILGPTPSCSASTSADSGCRPSASCSRPATEQR
jgi:CubicO group peptidase (beta-lactamase class C family)